MTIGERLQHARIRLVLLDHASIGHVRAEAPLHCSRAHALDVDHRRPAQTGGPIQRLQRPDGAQVIAAMAQQMDFDQRPPGCIGAHRRSREHLTPLPPPAERAAGALGLETSNRTPNATGVA